MAVGAGGEIYCQVRALLACFLASLQLHCSVNQMTLISALGVTRNIPDIADFFLFQNVATIAAARFRLDYIWIPVTFCHDFFSPFRAYHLRGDLKTVSHFHHAGGG